MGPGRHAIQSTHSTNPSTENTSMSDSVAAKVREIIIDELGVEADKVNAEASFVDDLGADSLDTVELIMAFEEEFEIDIPDEDAEQMRTVGDAVAYIENRSD